MRSIVLQITLLSILILLLSFTVPPNNTIAPGAQPQITTDTKGIIRLVYGRADSIFCATSKDKGETFSQPTFVGHITGMHLGMTRGPQLASSNSSSIITAIDKTGNIHYFQLSHTNNKWTYKGLINDITASAPEGLMSIIADKQDNFYAVWLDIRQEKHNNIAFSTLTAKETKWQKNNIVYTSPDEHVCECCKPSIAINGQELSIMFRNWIQGSRDLYLLTSSNKGKTFNEAQKLGTGTWQLKACPMDGGGIIIDNTGIKHSVWRREGNIYYCKVNEPEILISKGKICSITASNTSNKIILSMQEGENVKVYDLTTKAETLIGKGSFLKSLILPDNTLLCIWEEDKTIKYKKI